MISLSCLKPKVNLQSLNSDLKINSELNDKLKNEIKKT